VHHDPVGPDVHPAVVRVTGDVVGPGAEIPSTIARVPLRSREHRQVDVVTSLDVLHHGAIAHLDRRDEREPRDALPPDVRQLKLGKPQGRIQRQSHPIDGAESVHQHSKALAIPGDLVEDHRGRAIFVLQHVCSCPDLLLGIGSMNHPELIMLVRELDPSPQVQARALFRIHSRSPLCRLWDRRLVVSTTPSRPLAPELRRLRADTLDNSLDFSTRPRRKHVCGQRD